MKSLFIVLSFICCTQLSLSQEWKLKKTYFSDFNIWDIDPLGNLIYAKNDALYKLDTAFNIQFKQSFKSFGNITSIDASYAQKTLVFGKDMQYISFLDNTLTSSSGNENLEDLGVDYAKFVCFSQISTRYWVYDDVNSKFFRFDEGAQEPILVENLNLLLDEIELVDFFESNNYLYLITESSGIYLFDNFGTLVNRIPLANTHAVEVVNETIYYLKNDTLAKRELDGFETFIELPEKGILDFKILGDYIYFKSNETLKKYSLKLN
ncbi:MAG: hypothetical protein ACPGU5_05620 [Lishizhenia sp.]